MNGNARKLLSVALGRAGHHAQQRACGLVRLEVRTYGTEELYLPMTVEGGGYGECRGQLTTCGVRQQQVHLNTLWKELHHL